MQNIPINSESNSNVDAADSLSVEDLWGICWRGRWIVIGATLLFALSAVAYALLATKWYRADVVMTISSTKTADSLAGQLGSLGGLASLAGISVGGGSTSEPIAVLRSREFTRSFIEQRQLLPVLFSSEWDSRGGRWVAADPGEWPDIRDAVKFFDEDVRTIQEDKKTGLITLSVQWTDATVAADWANKMVDAVNDLMRRRALQEAEFNVSFLQRELASSNVIALQQSLGRLLDSEMQKLMLARGKRDFAFRVIDRAEVPKWRFRPKRVQIVLLGALLGFALSIFSLLLRHGLVGRRRRQIPTNN